MCHLVTDTRQDSRLIPTSQGFPTPDLVSAADLDAPLNLFRPRIECLGVKTAYVLVALSERHEPMHGLKLEGRKIHDDPADALGPPAEVGRIDGVLEFGHSAVFPIKYIIKNSYAKRVCVITIW
jgi:hypothetical protein